MDKFNELAINDEFESDQIDGKRHCITDDDIVQWWRQKNGDIFSLKLNNSFSFHHLGIENNTKIEAKKCHQKEMKKLKILSNFSIFFIIVFSH